MYKSDGTTIINQLTGFSRVEGVAFGDYNNDGLNDLAFTEPLDGKVTVIYGTRALWEYVFVDPCRGTELRISTDDEYFQFIGPDIEFPITQADKMKFRRDSFRIYHKDENIRLIAFGNTRLDFCIAFATDMQTGQRYFLHDKADWGGWRTTGGNEYIAK